MYTHQYQHQQAQMQNLIDLNTFEVNVSSFEQDLQETFVQQILFKCSFCPYASLHLMGLTAHMDVHLTQLMTPWYHKSRSNYPLKPKVTKKKNSSDREKQPCSTVEKDKIKKDDDNSLLYCCHRCPFRASTAIEVIRHTQQNHDNKKPFQCHVCSYSTTTEKILRKHLATHSAHRRYTCPYCPYKTNSVEHLKNHLRCHTGERPFECPYDGCTYAAAQEVALQIHVRRHTGVRPYCCPECDYTGRQMNHLKKHMQALHPKA